MRRLWRDADPATRVLVLVVLWVLTRVAVLVGTRATGLYPAQTDAFRVEGFEVWGRAFTGQGGAVPLRDVPWEYPFGAVPVVVLPALLEGAPYQLAFIAEMALIDGALLLVLLLRALRGGSFAGAAWWVAAVPLLGPVALARYDVLPAMLAGVGLLAAPVAPLAAGTLLGLGAVAKLWPAVLVPLALLPRWPERAAVVRVLAGAVGVGVVGLALTRAAYGLQHLLAPLEYQSERGLEIEALPALPLLLGAVVADRPAVVTFEFGAYQVDGPGAPLLLTVAGLGVPLVVLAVLALAWRARRSADRTQSALVLAVLMIAAVLVFDKVLSAQYPVWLAGVLAAALSQRGSPVRAAVLPAAGILLLTQLGYPVFFEDLVAVRPRGVAVMAARAVLLVGLTAWLAVVAWRVTRPVPSAALPKDQALLVRDTPVG